MEMRHLEAFLVVAEERSFTRAAQRLHLSQPPLSMRIKELESELLVSLFERTTRSVNLTPAGQAFLEKSREALVMLTSAVENCRQVERGITGRLRIGYTGIASDVVLPRLIKEFRKYHPEISIDIMGPSPSGPLELALLNDEIDVALCFLPPTNRQIDFRILTTTQLAVALPENHALSQFQRVPVKRLEDEAFVAYPVGQGFFLRQAIENECLRAGFRPRVVRESPASQTLLCLVAAGNCIAIIPLEHKLRRTEGVIFRPLSPKEQPPAYGLAWRKKNRVAALSHFQKLASQVFPALERYGKREQNFINVRNANA